MITKQLEEYRSIHGRRPFSEWLLALDDSVARVRIARRLTRLRAGLMGDSKSVGGGVIELREDHGPGYRVYCARYGSARFVLLAGGDKHTQHQDIERAKEYWQDWKQRQAR